MENLQLENYFSRLKEVLEVHGKLELNDLEYCKLLTEREVVNNLLKPDVNRSSCNCSTVVSVHKAYECIECGKLAKGI